MSDNRIMWVCPKCGAIKIGEPTDHCGSCGTSVVSTGVTPIELYSRDDEARAKWKADVLQKYAPNLDTVLKQSRVAAEEEAARMASYIPKCPTCGCPKIRYLTESENTLSLAFAGNGQISLGDKITRFTGKTFFCEKCGYTW